MKNISKLTSPRTAKLHDSEASANPAPGGDTCGDGEFRGVWGSSKCTDELMDPGDLLASIRAAEEARNKVGNIVGAPVPRRWVDGDKCGMSMISGCWGRKKNMCREHILTPGETTALGTLTTRLHRWVD